MRILRVPFLFGFRAMAPAPGIALVRTGVTGDELDWTLRHEAVHHEQMRRDGWLRFAGRYLVSGAWRARYEAEAYGRVNLAREAQRRPDLDDVARRYARQVGRRYYPRLWPGTAPDPEWLATLMLAAYERTRPPTHPPDGA